MPIQIWFWFACAASVAIVYPGPTMLTVISYSLTYGRRSYLPLLIAVSLGDATALALSFLGLGLLETSGFLLMAVNFISGLYLLYFGVRRLRAGTSPARLNAPPKPHSRWQLFANTYLVTGFNPKSIPLLLVLLDGFVNKSADNVAQQRFILAVTFVILSAIGAALYMAFAASARRLVSSPLALRRFHIAGGLLLSAAGVWALARSLLWARAHDLL